MILVFLRCVILSVAGLLAGDVARGRISVGDASAARDRLSTTTDLAAFSNTDFVIEVLIGEIINVFLTSIGGD